MLLSQFHEHSLGFLLHLECFFMPMITLIMLESGYDFRRYRTIQMCSVAHQNGAFCYKKTISRKILINQKNWSKPMYLTFCASLIHQSKTYSYRVVFVLKVDLFQRGKNELQPQVCLEIAMIFIHQATHYRSNFIT